MTGRQIGRAMFGRVVEAVRISADDLLGRAQRDAPVLSGALRGSGTVDLFVDANSVEAVVSFTVPHAAVQHERLDYIHPKGGRAKYLEANLQEMAGRYKRVIAAAARVR